MCLTNVNYQVKFKELYRAWQVCQKRKAGKPAAQRFELNLLDNLFYTQQQLQLGQYQTTASYCFVTTQPKLREIHAATFSDRVVHHLLVPQLEKLWEPWFIFDVYSNRKHKGTHKAVKRLQRWVRKPKCGYFLQLDIKNFFYSIQHKILLSFLNKGLLKALKQQKITQEKYQFLYLLCQRLMESDFSKTQEVNPYLSSKVPSYKRLKHQPKGQGLPIGNLSSQFFANVYLNALDQFVKHELKCSHYLRFVDDFILLANTPQQLHRWHLDIQHFLSQQLALTLKAPMQLKAVNQGADFLGYVVKPYVVLVRKRVVRNLKQKLKVLKQQCKQGLVNNTLFVSQGYIQQVQATLASYIGHFKHAHCLKLLTAVWQKNAWLSLFFELDLTHLRLQVKTETPKGANYAQQIAFFTKHYPNAKLLVEFGCLTKCYVPAQYGMEANTQKALNAPCVQINIVQAGFRAQGRRRRRIQSWRLSDSFLKHLKE